MGELAYLDDFSVIECGVFGFNLGSADRLVTEERRHRLLGGILIFLDTLLALVLGLLHLFAYTEIGQTRTGSPARPGSHSFATHRGP